MDQEVLDRAFEPFFTTKDIGKGSGLGLSQVHSFVTAAEGHIRVESAPGKGTPCHLNLPHSTQEERVGRESEEPERAVRGGCETILVVKDDSGVLEVALKTIRGFGYDVVTARTNGARATIESFMTGMLDSEKNEFHSRPSYVFQMADGSILVSDELHGATYRISYTAPATAAVTKKKR